jgi:hypothetical protein
MPNPEHGCDALQSVFVEHIFKEKFNKQASWSKIAALSGAHTIG